MTSFLTVIASPAIREVIEKSIFGKPYVRIGKLFHVLGYWVYQQGGVLGYALRDNPALLGKLAAPPETPNMSSTEIAETLEGLAETVASEMEEVKNEKKVFFYLFTVRELRSLGIELIKWPPDKNLNKKVDLDYVQLIMHTSFIEGVALAFNFPEQFSTYWNNSYKMRPDSEWEEMRRRGIVLSEIQERRTLQQAIKEVCENAILWGKSQSPNTLDIGEIETLQAVIIGMRKE